MVTLTDTLTDITNINKIAFKYSLNDFSLWVNGVEVDSVLSGSVFPSNTLNTFRFDRISNSNPFYGRIKEIKVYDTILTDAQLQTLTTL